MNLRFGYEWMHPGCMKNQISYVRLEVLLEGRPKQRRLRLRGARRRERREEEEEELARPYT